MSRAFPPLFLTLCWSLSAAVPGPVGAAELRPEIDRLVEPYVAAADFSGVIGVQRDGEEPLLLPYGLASVELGVPHREDGIFMIGSVSKQFTAVAILLLEEDGRLRTEDAITRFLPNFPGGEGITVEQLLTHRSGIADVYSLDSFGAAEGMAGSFPEVIGELGRHPRTHAPGAASAYSNGGYSVAAAVIEAASGRTYGEFLRARIFEPLGMTRSAHDAPGPAVDERVPGYDPWGARSRTPVAPVAPAFTTGSGSIWSCARDLLEWSRALHAGTLLRPESYAKFRRDSGDGYGYGISMFRRFDRQVLGHDGRVAGYASDLARYVTEDLTIVVLSNVQSVARDEIRRDVAAAVFGEEAVPATLRSFEQRSPEALPDFAGVYEFGPQFHVSAFVADGRLMVRANQGGASELVPLNETEWFSRMLYATVGFGRDASGRVEALIWGQGEGAPRGQRLN